MSHYEETAARRLYADVLKTCKSELRLRGMEPVNALSASSRSAVCETEIHHGYVYRDK